MTESPLVSIVIPVYNGTNYLKEAIDSALRQTYKNIEVIVVNDGSTDNGGTESIALSYGDKIRYISKENGGVASALNCGIMEMKGEYFSWLSHDDIYKENKIEEQIQFLKKYPQEKVIVYSDYELLENGHRKSCITGSVYSSSEYSGLYPVFFNIVHGCTLLIPKYCFEISGLFDETLDTTNDYELFFRMGCSFDFIYLKKYLVTVRVHEKQDSFTKRDKHISDCNRLWVHFINTYPVEKMLQTAPSRFVFMRRISNFLKESPYTVAYDFVRKDSVKAFRENLLLNYFISFVPVFSGIILYKKWYIRIRRIIVKFRFLLEQAFVQD